MEETTDVAVIGAGPAGLAVGACLRQAGLRFIILEKERQLAASWRGHYERLHLHTVKHFSSLPFLAFPKSYPRYVPRQLVIEYLETYAQTFGLEPRFGETVRSASRNGKDWLVEATSGSVRAPYLVVACGNNSEPLTPAVPGIDRFKGRIIHSADYANAAPFAGQSVLIVGMGNTGAEIALDLAEGGARPTISIRDGVHIAPRDLFGVPIQIVAMLATRLLPLKVNDVLFPVILDVALGDLSKYGIRRPKQGILEQIASSAKIPVLDVGAVGKISAGAIKVVPGISGIADDGVTFKDGSKGAFDAIIFATGYRPNYQDFLPPEVRAASNGGARSKPDAQPRVFFVGYHNPVTGLLREIGIESRRVANDILAQKAISPAARPRVVGRHPAPRA